MQQNRVFCGCSFLSPPKSGQVGGGGEGGRLREAGAMTNPPPPRLRRTGDEARNDERWVVWASVFTASGCGFASKLMAETVYCIVQHVNVIRDDKINGFRKGACQLLIV